MGNLCTLCTLGPAWFWEKGREGVLPEAREGKGHCRSALRQGGVKVGIYSNISLLSLQSPSSVSSWPTPATRRNLGDGAHRGQLPGAQSRERGSRRDRSAVASAHIHGSHPRLAQKELEVKGPGPNQALPPTRPSARGMDLRFDSSSGLAVCVFSGHTRANNVHCTGGH